MKKEILTNIMHGGEYGMATEASSYYHQNLSARAGAGVVNPVLTATGTGPSWISHAEEQKEETRKIIEQYKQMMQEEIKQTKKSKHVEKTPY